MEYNYYEILGIAPHASDEEIKAAYKKLAKRYHPDKHPGNSFYEEHFKKINNAYQTISDPEKRKRYDLKLLYYTQKKTTASAATPPPPRAAQRPRPSQPKKAPALEKSKIIKYSIITGVAFAVFITAAIFFYNFMNRVTAKDRLQEGKLMEEHRKYLTAWNYYNEAIAYDPSLSEAYVRRAYVRSLTMQDHSGAISDYTKAISAEEKPGYNLFFLRAKSYLKLKEYDKGLKDLNYAIELNSGIDSLYFYRAEVNNLIKKEYAASIPDYEQALKLNNTFTDARFGKAFAHQNLGEHKEALQDLNELIERYPEEGSYYYYRGYSSYNLKNSEEACSDWQTAESKNFSGAKEAWEKYCGK